MRFEGNGVMEWFYTAGNNGAWEWFARDCTDSTDVDGAYSEIAVTVTR